MTTRVTLVIGATYLSIPLGAWVLIKICGVNTETAVAWAMLMAIAIGGVLLLRAWWNAKHMLPTCENGRCQTSDYELIGHASKLGIQEDGLVWECRCGRRYLAKQNRFLRIEGMETGFRKYKVREGLLFRWNDDL